MKKPLPLLLTSDSENEFVGMIFVYVKVVSLKVSYYLLRHSTVLYVCNFPAAPQQTAFDDDYQNFHELNDKKSDEDNLCMFHLQWSTSVYTCITPVHLTHDSTSYLQLGYT